MLRLFIFVLKFLILNLYTYNIITPEIVWAKTIEIPSSPNLVGSGARSIGMGSAFIAIADDATAASWNPAGLFQLKKPELSIVTDYIYRVEDNTYCTEPEASGPQSISKSNINYLSLAMPFVFFNRNVALTLSYQNLYDFNRQWDYSIVEYEKTDEPRFVQVDYHQKGNLSALGIAFAIRINDNLAFGITCNLWEDWFKNHSWTQTTREKIESYIVDEGKTNVLKYHFIDKNSYSFKGFNYNIGILYTFKKNMTLGFVFKSPFKAKLKQTLTSVFSYNQLETEGQITTDGHLHMPLHSGIGFSWQITKKLNFSTDIFRSEWNDFVREISGKKVSPISGLNIKDSDIDPTHQIRMGIEYLLVNKKSRYVIPLRCGIFYDPAPEEKNPDDIYGFSLGTGLAIEKYIFDIAYQYRFGRDIRSSMYKYLDFSQDLNEHNIYLSMVYHF